MGGWSWDGPGPDINVLFGWWGTSTYQSSIGLADIAAALNLGPFGGNPPFQIDDFLAIYPKFGTGVLGVSAASLAAGGTGYSVNDVLTLVQPDAQGAQVKVVSIGGGGVVTTFSIVAQGSGYSVSPAGSPLAVTGGTGTGATFNVTAITPTNLVIVPVPVLQLYLNLASACLSSCRWGEMWPMAMALFVAHFVTLYLMSEGNPGNTPGAIARSGLAAGVIVSQSAGDVNKSIEPPDLGQFAGTWAMTVYGQQLKTFANTVGAGMVYAW